MAIIDIDGIIDNIHGVEDTLSRFADRFFKALQVLVDNDAPDPNENNADYVFTIPIEFYAQCYTFFQAYQATNDYNSYDNGYQPVLFCFDLSLDNGVLSIDNFQCLGKLYTGSGYSNMWRNLSDAQKADLVEQVKNYFTGNLEITSDYSTEPDVFTYSNGGIFNFRTRDHSDSLHFEYNSLDGVKRSTRLQVSMMNESYTPRLDTDTDLISPTYNSFSKPQNGVMYCQKRPFQMITRDESWAINWVTTNDAEHNYVDTHTTAQGTFKVYYGDNYLIYYIPQNVPLSYNVIKNATVTASNKINSDNPSAKPIVIKSYEENKYGPEPEPVTDDDYVDMGLGVETDGMAMYNMAVITRDDLIQLITDFEANADTGLSFIPHVLGLYKLGIESSQLLTTKSEQIKLHKEPNGTSAFTSVENYNIVKDQLTIIDCGSITIDREELLTNTFYDYSPYSTYEMFIPGCGWITLPDTVVGRTISVSIVFDLTTCSCKGIVRSEGQLLGGSGTTLATVNGIIGSSVPLSINETGLQRAAIFNGSTQAAMALGTAFLGVGIGNPYMGASGVAMAAGALADNHVAGNTTYTNTKGGATDYSVFGDGYKAVLKITRPVVEIPDNYGHTVGFVVNEYGMLSDFHGFTVCVNPHIHISATSDEKEEIKRLLESGVILPDGE